MGLKKACKIGIKLGALTLLYYLGSTIVSLMIGLGQDQQPANPGRVAVIALLVSFLSVAAISYPVMRSKWTGWRLVLTVFIVLFGIRTFLSQIETIVFLRYLKDIIPADMVPLLIVEGFVTAAFFAPLCVLVLGKFKPHTAVSQSMGVMGNKELAVRLVLIGLVYVLIYIGFGMFVFRPLAGSAFDQFYTNLHLPRWIIPFQVLRGILWGLLALPVIRMMRGEFWEKGLAVALLFSVIMGSLLLIPSDFMPERIRLAHFVELITSNFVFGWLVAWLLTKKRGK
ncbi:MAG TPA: hypothetical protein VHS59_11520 [Bacillota bacterium]|nr:hypothetical protein [Bacillota bacterium]